MKITRELCEEILNNFVTEARNSVLNAGEREVLLNKAKIVRSSQQKDFFDVRNSINIDMANDAEELVSDRPPYGKDFTTERIKHLSKIRNYLFYKNKL